MSLIIKILVSFLNLVPQDKLDSYGYYRLQKDDIYVTQGRYCCLFRRNGSDKNKVEEIVISDDYGGVVSLTLFEAQNLFNRVLQETQRRRYNV